METEIIHTRHNPLVDPDLSIWGWEIPGYLFLGGLTAGILILSGIFFLWKREEEYPFTVHLAPIFAPLFLSIGMLFLFLDLEHKLYTWRLYLTFEWTSPMSWGSWALILIYPTSILFALMQLRSHHRQAAIDWLRSTRYVNAVGRPLADMLERIFPWADGRRRYARVLAWINVLMGVFIAMYTGILLSSFVARPFWNSPILGVLFLASGLSSASAMMILGTKKESEEHGMIRIDIAFLLVELFLLSQLFISYFTSSQYHIEAGMMIFGGDYTGLFWMLVVLQGILFPLFMEIMELKNKFRFRLITPLSVLIGGLLLRILFVYIGQHSSVGL
ncbi:MAG: polysulfide reductase NrfD [Leptospiraceae bacterium]|nr:polysulfide reductase NrfD [Leptospiraceae bacterium]